jgi:O-succinylbenzoic acid--CoA ligase
MASLVPTMLQRILDVDPGPYAGLKAILLGGAPAPVSLVERALDAGLPVLQTYGMTEGCSQVTTVEPGAARVSMGTAGPPLHGYDVTIIGDEITIDGPAMSPGYFGEPLRVGPYRTGDLGRLDDEGRLVVVGRIGDVVITGGENVHPAVVEAAIKAHPTVRDVVVVGLADDEWGEIVVAVVELHGETVEAVEAATAGRLARHEIPKRWVIVEHIDLLSNGKPDRAAVRAVAADALGIPLT